MRNIKQLELTLESPEYSWHIAESDRETWVILRNNKRLEECLITAITGVSLKLFTRDVFLQEKGKRFYKGVLGLCVECATTRMSESRLVFTDAAAEEGLSRELFIRADKSPFPQYQPKEEPSRLFADVLLDGTDTAVPIKGAKDTGITIDIPWQAWLYGEGKVLEPKLVKVHAAQTGLCSVLIEAVIKLEIQKEGLSQESTSTRDSLIMKEETRLFIKDKEIDDVIGIAGRTAFHANYRYPGVDSIILESFNKMSVVFISPQTAQARIMVATAFSRVQREVSGCQLSSLWPVGFELSNHTRKIVRDCKNKMFYQNEEICTLDYETKKEAVCEEVLPESERVPALLFASPAALVRQKPGEKYMKESGQDKTAKNKYKSVFVISLKK